MLLGPWMTGLTSFAGGSKRCQVCVRSRKCFEVRKQSHESKLMQVEVRKQQCKRVPQVISCLSSAT